MLRIHFTEADLARVRLVTRPAPMWDTVLSIHQLQTRQGFVFDVWRRHARQAAKSSKVRDAIRVLTTVNPRCLYFPDFLTPLPGEESVEGGVAEVVSTPQKRMR